MTIPISTPQIGATGVVQQPGIGDIVNHALLQWQELATKREELKRKQAEFELSQKLAGTQLEGMKLQNEKTKREFKEKDDDLAAQSEALQLYTGALPRLQDPQAIGEVIARIKDNRVAGHFYDLIIKGQQARSATLPNYQFQDAAGVTPGTTEKVAFNPEDPTHPVRTGVAGAPPQPTQRIPVVTEREKASAAIGAAQANAIVNQLEAKDPGIAARVAKRVAAYRAGISAIGKRLMGASPEEVAIAAESQIEQSMTPDELAFYQSSKQYLGAVLPGLAGKAVTGKEWLIQAPIYFSMGSTTPQVTTNRRKARATRIRGLLMEAGDAASDRMAELPDPQEYGLGTVILPDSTQHVITPGKARYHPKFRP